ncbi:SprT-like domain-containing protein [Haloferax larsenii]|uniref:Predicted Zn-dependent metalloprotease, SprT family n=1 Tax=Haloferax larsenii TaxID=302484 RepID=A0A1H7N615_HALLR|nr:SprT-like domain-containing protein [Haloferax larsenii]SEL18749.1 Predicted Zn-dependent metalloprotease, SprT family [Haloferax larsenii]
MTFHLPSPGSARRPPTAKAPSSRKKTKADGGFTRPGDGLTPSELKLAIREYAETVDIDVPLDKVEIQVSKRLRRAAGKAGKKDGQYFMRFAWKAYQSWGWNDDWEGTIRHELVHIWEYEHHGKGGHGYRFKVKAAELDAPRHCPSFAHDEAKWFLKCEECGREEPRFRRSKVIENPHRYRTGCCKASIEVVEA